MTKTSKDLREFDVHWKRTHGIAMSMGLGKPTMDFFKQFHLTKQLELVREMVEECNQMEKVALRAGYHQAVKQMKQSLQSKEQEIINELEKL